jgi:anti-sigma B factor antagonist
MIEFDGSGCFKKPPFLFSERPFKFLQHADKRIGMMRKSVEKSTDAAIIVLKGSFDLGEVTEFETLFKSLLMESPEVIAIQMKDLNYIDSSGIGSLIRCMNYALRDGIKLVCYNLNSSIKMVFDVTRLEYFIEVLTEEEFTGKYLRNAPPAQRQTDTTGGL